MIATGTAFNIGQAISSEWYRPQPKQKNAYGKRIIRSFTKDGFRYELHATKGWRKYRV